MGQQISTPFSGATTGSTLTVDYTSDFTTLNGHLLSISSSLSALISYFELNLGQGGALVPGTLSNSANMISKGVAEVLGLNNQEMKNNNTTLIGSLQNISSQIAALSATAAQSVATQQISVANQIQKNKFDQTATQAALQRNGLPAVEVSSADLIDTIRANVQSASEVAASASATGLVTGVANTAFTKATSYVSGMLPSLATFKDFFSSSKVMESVDVETTTKQAEVALATQLIKAGTYTA